MPRSGGKTLKAGDATKAKTERAKRYEAARAMGAALTEHVSNKLTSEAIELIFTEVVFRPRAAQDCGTPSAMGPAARILYERCRCDGDRPAVAAL